MTLWMRPRRNDEADKATWPDLSGKKHHGTLSGFAWTEASGWTPYPALKLAGDNDKVVTDASADLACSGPVTVEVWCTPPAGTGGLMLLGTGTELTDGYALYLRHAAGADVSWRVNPDGTMRYIVVGTIAYGALNHITGTWDGTDLIAYVGVVRHVFATSAVGATRSAAPAVNIGYNATIGYGNPALHAVRIYNGVAFTPEQVAQNDAAGPFGRGYVKDGLVLDLNAAYCVPVLPKVASRAGERATPYTVSFALATAVDPETPVSGLTPAVIVARDGGPFAAAEEAATEPGSAGVYAVPLTDAEMDGAEVGLVASAAGVTDHVEVLHTIPDLQAIAAAALVDHPVPTTADIDAAVAPLAKDATVAKEASIAALNDLSQEQAEEAAVAALAAHPVPTKAELDAAVAPLAQEETLEAVADVADAIKLRTDRIGTASALVIAPVTTAGTLTLRQGDDYSAEYDRAVTFAVDDAAHKLKLDEEGVVVRLKSTQATWTATGVTSTDDGYLVTFQPTAADTRALTIPRQPYELEARLADGDVVTLTVGTLVCEPDIPAVT